MAGVKIAALVVALVVVACAVTAAEAAVSCGQVTSSLAPCLGYLRSGGVPPAGCCSGVARIAGSAKTTADRQQACNCLKSAAGSVSGINPNNAASLPGKCKVNIPYKISLSTNCNSIK